MKKSLMVLVALFMMILIPGNVKAIELVRNADDTFDCSDPVTVGDKKQTTCEIKVKTGSNEEYPGGVVTLNLKPTVSSTTATFKLTADTKVAQLDTTRTNADKMAYVIDIEPIAAGRTVTLGTVTFIADAKYSGKDCGGEIDPVWDQSEGDDIGGGDIPETGYAIPYVALAIGAVGVITVLATSKKKTKMYKI